MTYEQLVILEHGLMQFLTEHAMSPLTIKGLTRLLKRVRFYKTRAHGKERMVETVDKAFLLMQDAGQDGREASGGVVVPVLPQDGEGPEVLAGQAGDVSGGAPCQAQGGDSQA